MTPREWQRIEWNEQCRLGGWAPVPGEDKLRSKARKEDRARYDHILHDCARIAT